MHEAILLRAEEDVTEEEQQERFPTEHHRGLPRSSRVHPCERRREIEFKSGLRSKDDEKAVNGTSEDDPPRRESCWRSCG